jgi:hypothetical protein
MADGARIDEGLNLRDGFSSTDMVSLGGARIGGDLDCVNGTINNEGGVALNIERADIKGDVFLRGTFSAVGEIRMLNTVIGGDFECEGGTFRNSGGTTLNLSAARIEGNVILAYGFSSDGTIRVLGCQVGGTLECQGGKFNTLIVDTSTVRGRFDWYHIQDVRNVHLALRNTSVDAVVDEQASWPWSGNLDLDGFVYSRFADGPTSAMDRMDWLGRQKNFTLQPYHQLSKVLREMGDETGAKEVLFQMERRSRFESRRRLIHAPARWLRSSEDSLSEVTIGYGIYPGNAVWELLGLMALGWVLHRRAQGAGLMVPTEKDAYIEFRHKGKATDNYPPFSPLIYVLENCIPFIRFGQDDKWQADPSPLPASHLARAAGSKWTRLKSLFLTRLRNRMMLTAALRWLRWGMICLGWLLATYLVASLTGIIKVE